MLVKSIARMFILALVIVFTASYTGADTKNSTAKKKNKADKGTIDFSKESLFTGDVSFSIPIASLGGISVELSYNSNMHMVVRAQNKFSQSGWVGLGWTMSLGTITGDINNTRDISDDRYYLNDNGVSGELMHESGDTFVLRDYKYWKITRHVVSGSIVGWTIVTEDGTIKRFGNYNVSTSSFILDLLPTYATRFLLGWGNLVANHAGVGSPSYIPYQWDLCDVQDINGSHTTVKYQQLTGTLSGSSLTYTRESYPLEIVDRTGRKITFVLNGTPLVTIDNPLVGYGQSRYETQSLSYIYEKDPNNVTYSGFQFEYDVDDVFDKVTFTNRKIYLKKIKQLDALSVSMRDTKFEYAGVATSLLTTDYNPGAVKKITLPVGGTIEYTYAVQTVVTDRNPQIATGGNFWSSFGVGQLSSNPTFFSLSGTDFFVIQRSVFLEMYKWDHTNRIKLDNSFPLAGLTLDVNSGFWVQNDFVILKYGNSLVVAKRDGDKWRKYTIEGNVTDITKLQIVGLGSDYFLYALNCGGTFLAPTNGELKVAKFRNTQTWTIQSLGTKFVGSPQSISCGSGFFAGGYNLGVWNWNETNGLWEDKTPSGNYSNYDNAGSDYIVKKGGGPNDFIVYRWSGSTWNPFYLSPTVTLNNGAQFYTGNNFFVIKGVGSESPIIKIVTYTSSGWTVQDISSVFSEAIINDRTRLTVGPDYIVLTWRLTSADTWKIGLIRYKNGTWQNGVVMNSYAATPASDPDSQYETFTPFISGGTIFAEMYEPTSKLQTYSFTEYGNTWDSQQTNNLSLGWGNGYQNPLKPFIQPGSNFSVCVIDQNLQYQGDGQLLAWKKTYGDDPSTSVVDFREVFSDALSGGYDYIVATKKVSDGMGNIIQTNFQFEKGAYDDNISSVKYNKATETPSGSNGKTVSYFYNDKGLGDAEDFVNVPNYQAMDGLQYKKKIFENGGATPFNEITNTWSAQAVGISYGNERIDPIETHTAGTWIAVPSGGIHQVIDDGDILNTSDYTYSVNPDLFTVRLQPMLNSPSPTGYCVITADVKPHYSGQEAMFYLVLWQWNGTGLSFIAEQNVYLPETQQNYSAATLTVSNSSISNPGQLYVSVDCLISTVDVARVKANVDFQVDKGIYHRRMIQEVATQDGVSKTSTYEYSNLNGLVSRSIETNSDGTQRFTRMKYPLDYPNTSGSSPDLMVQALDDMKNGKHIHNAVIERLVSGLKQGDVEKVISASLTKYKRYGSSQVLASHELNVRNPDPIAYSGFTQSSSTTSAFTLDSRYITTGTFDLYDSFGNSLQMTNANGVPTSTKWALNSVVPVATFVNAPNAQSFFDEFGDGDFAGWTALDNGSDGDTQWSVENGILKQINFASASSEEKDRIQYDIGAEIAGDVVLEYDLRIADSNNWDFTVGAGGDLWSGLHSGSAPEEAIWTAINNETFYYLSNTGWVAAQSGLVIGRTYHFKIVVKPSTGKADYYLDGLRIVTNGNLRATTTGIDKINFGNYGYGSITSTWYIDNVRLYPAAGLASSQSFDPITLNATQAHSENGLPTYYEYDSFQRLTREVSFDNRIIKEHSYYDSRVGNGDVFSSSDPNSEGLVEYADGLSKDGLAGHWRFEGNAKDESGNSNNGTFNGNAVSKRGYSGSGLLLDGFGDWVGSPHSSSLNISGGSITLSAWVKFGVANNLRFIVEKMASTGRQYYMWWHYSAGIIVGYHDGTAFRDYSYAWTPVVGNWYHLAWTANGSNVRIYVNGVMVASYTQTGNLQNTTTGNCDIGRNAGGAYYFTGSIDEVRIYKRALSETEIKSQYNARVVSNYADGIGREIQNQVVLANSDIVTPITYDLLGRKSKAYKSYIPPTTNGHKYDPNYVTNSNAYYTQDGGYPYAEMQYRAEPTARPQKQGDPGTNHRVGSGNELKTDYFGEVATGRLKTRQTDEDGKTSYNYTDKFGNVVRTVVDSLGLNLATHFDYDVMGKMIKSTTPSGLASTFSYNTLHQLRQKTSPDAGTWSYLYDQIGNLRLITDGRGWLIYKKYDSHNRVIEEGRYTGSGSNFTQANANIATFPTSPILLEKTFSYDLPTTDALASNQRNVSGRVAVANSYDANTWKWTTFYSYNELGFVEWVVQKNAWGKAWKITYDRDIQGRETKKGFADSYNGYNLYTFTEYDMAGRIKKVSTNPVDDPITATKEAEYTHTATNKPSTLMLGNTAQTVSYTYNERDFVKTISSARFTQTLYYHDVPPFSATPRKNGNIAAMTTNYAALGQMGFAYTYDNASRLTVAQTWLNSGSWATSNNFKIATIGYNGAGNITAMQRYGFNGNIMDNLTYNYVGGTNRLNYITDAVASGSFATDIDNQGSGNYSYDGNGSALQDLGSGITSISYGIRNLPVSLTKSSISYTYNYDVADSRVYSTESNRFYVNGADGKTEAVVDVSNNALITHNIWGNDLVGQIKRNGGLTRFYQLKDHLGSIRVTVDIAGADVARDDYDAWGMLLETRSYNAGQADSRYKFTAKERDPQTGLDYFGARYYDSRIGRWLTVDPLADQYFELSPYNYVAGNPLRLYDPDGRGIGDALRKLGKAITYNISVGLQVAGEARIGGKGVKMEANVVSTSLVSGDIQSAPTVLNGDRSYEYGATVGLVGANIEKTVSPTTTTTTREGIFTNITSTKTTTTAIGATLGPIGVDRQVTETTTTNGLSGDSKTTTTKTTQVGSGKDITIKGALVVGLEIKVDLSKVIDAIKEIKK